MKKEFSDTQLLDRIRQGDQAALDEVYLLFKQEFIHWVTKKFSNIPQDHAIDIYHDVVIIFYQNVKNGKLNQLHYSIKSYLFGIGNNYINSQLRAQKKSLRLEESFQTEMYDVREEVDVEEIFLLMEELIPQMKDRCKNLLRLFYFEEKSMPDITAIMNFKDKLQTAREKHRCVQRLKKAIFNQIKLKRYGGRE